jgi:hypothetical protein
MLTLRQRWNNPVNNVAAMIWKLTTKIDPDNVWDGLDIYAILDKKYKELQEPVYGI